MNILDVPMIDHDTEAKTVGEFMGLLAAAVWKWGESFSGKRPFGNSDWQYYVFASVVEAGLMEAEKDEYDWWRWTHEEERRVLALIEQATKEKFK